MKIASQAADEDRRAHVCAVMSRLSELSSHLQSQLKKADWATKREIIRAVVQRIEIGQRRSPLSSVNQPRRAPEFWSRLW
jgi:hypothetical protein